MRAEQRSVQERHRGRAMGEEGGRECVERRQGRIRSYPLSQSQEFSEMIDEMTLFWNQQKRGEAGDGWEGDQRLS
jgi:hypothetical protein